jgi:anti-sigma regulatory factor (Ser/Thr protein kinase)
VEFTLFLQTPIEEDVVLRQTLSHKFSALPENIVGICSYGFLEILNNAIEHSEGVSVRIVYLRNYSRIAIWIIDDGVGIFDKITAACGLADKHEAILELSKGKLTTDRTRHSGEGIFFTSRMFDTFHLMSGGLAYVRRRQLDDDWLVDIEMATGTEGTSVMMEISTNATQSAKEVTDKYIDDNARFSKTIVPLKLANYEGEHLVSRSQARRIMTRVERFSEVWLDFDGITEIGQPFADEIFRVWTRAHPNVSLKPYRPSPDVEKMIRHARANATEDGAPEQPSSDSERDARP